MLPTRSRLYRATTRAHMLVVVVNEVVPGGMLEFLQPLLPDSGPWQQPSVSRYS